MLEIRRREFIAALGGAAAWPLAARAQQGDRVRRIGVLAAGLAEDSVYQARHGAFQQELEKFGWSIGRNLRLDIRWAGIRPEDIRRQAAELAASAPDVILARGASTVAPLLEVTRTVPIVFPNIGDPVGAGLIDGMARPGGNATGFMGFEYSFSGKYLELLKEIAPNVTRVAVLRGADSPGGLAMFSAIQAVASLLRVEVTPINVRDAGGDRARCWGLRTRSERWRGGNFSPWDRDASRSNHRTGGPAPAAHGLPRTVLCRRRRLDLVRTR
jgi:putative ABC transport system substrate-binding protein